MNRRSGREAASFESMINTLKSVRRAVLRALKSRTYSDQAEAFAEALSQRTPSSGPVAAPGALEASFDAHEEGPGIWKWRHYFPIYEAHLNRFRGERLNLMEIGIFSGGSLPMWRQHLGPGCRVIGVDIEPACRAYAADGVDIFIGDQADAGFWAETLAQLPPLNVVIDDGGHKAHQQIASFESILPAMAPGGVYLCEDLHQRGNGFVQYLMALSDHLYAGQISRRTTPPGTTSPTSGPAKWIASIHFYPYMAVIQRTSSPPENWVSEKHGTQWEPFLQ